MPGPIRIAMLNADVPVPSVVSHRGPTYGRIFHDLLSAAAERVAPDISIHSTDFNVVDGHYPSLPIDSFDALLVTGSAASSYDDVPWIHRLDRFVAQVYTDFPEIKIFGSCFGHQLICQSLLRDCGAKVEKDPNGWELGVQEIQLTNDFARAVGFKPSRPLGSAQPTSETSQTMRLQFVHADHVRLADSTLPPGWIALGRSGHCALQGVYQPGRLLTYQGHFEFDRYINTETIRVFGADWNLEILGAALDAIDRDDDAELAAEMVLRFFLE